MTPGSKGRLLGRIALALLLALAAFAAGLYFGHRPSGIQANPDGVAVQELLRMELPTAEGTPQALSQWQGQWRIINYWATWCPPCREEMPEFSRLQKEYQGKGVQFVGIALDSSENVVAFNQATPAAYPLLIASPTAIRNLKALGNGQGALPYTLIIDPQGIVRETRLGALTATELRAILP